MVKYSKNFECWYGKNGELRGKEALSAPITSSLNKTLISLSSLFLQAYYYCSHKQRMMSLLGFLFVFYPSVSYSRIWFLPDAQNYLGSTKATSEDAERCKGYIFSSSGKCPQYHNQKTCTFNSSFISCDAVGWCKDNNYTVTSCNKPQYLTTQCPNLQSYYRLCTTDYKRACLEENSSYVNTCSSGWKIKESTACSYSSSWGFCCNKCAGYTETSSEPPAYYKLGGECNSCDGMRYKYVAASYPSGYTAGLTSCNGSGYTYSSSGYSGTKKCGKCTEKACPSGYSTSVTSCSSGYEFSTNGYSGDKACGMCTALSCPSGYSTSVTSCNPGYDLVTNGYSKGGVCGACVMEPCPSGYISTDNFWKNYGSTYSNEAGQTILRAGGYAVCINRTTLYKNDSMTSLTYDLDGYIIEAGTYTVTNTPMIRVKEPDGTLTLNGDVAVLNVYLRFSDKLVVNGNVTIITPGMFLEKGAKFCPSLIDTSKMFKSIYRDYWCVKGWKGWGDNTGSGACDFDGECYY